MLLLIYGYVFTGLWALIYVSLMYMNKNLVYFDKLKFDIPDKWPSLSVIVPACNEEADIEQAASSLVSQDYPHLQVILVNDRSTDNTGRIIDRLANDSACVTAIHINSLPEGWLGKVHALEQGMKQATGDWILITDADINFSNNILKNTIAYVLKNKIDHLALMPGIVKKNFWLQVAIQSFGLLFLLSTRATSVNKEGSKNIIGVGAFNLVKRDTFRKTPGFSWLKMETVDDMGVGLMMNNAGGQSHFAIADKALRLSWYESVSAMFRGLEKNLFGAGPGYNPFKLVSQVVIIWCLLAAPFVTFAIDDLALNILLGSVVVLYILFSVFFVREKQLETLRLLLFPLGLFLTTLMMLWAGFKCMKNGGIKWRGTHYTIKQLKAGQRVRF